MPRIGLVPESAHAHELAVKGLRPHQLKQHKGWRSGTACVQESQAPVALRRSDGLELVHNATCEVCGV